MKLMAGPKNKEVWGGGVEVHEENQM